MDVDYSGLLSALAAKAADARRRGHSPFVIAISGHGGSGKSTLAARLAAELDGTVVGTDGMYARDAGPASGLWALHDWPAIIDLLRGLRTAQRLTYRKRWYTGEEFDVDEPLPAVVILEGIRVIRPDVLALVDAAVWLECPPAEAGERAKARNRLQGDDEAEIALWDTKWVPEGHAYESAVGPAALADFTINTSIH